MEGKSSEARSAISGKKIKLKVKKTKEDMEVRSAFPSRNIGYCDSSVLGGGGVIEKPFIGVLKFQSFEASVHFSFMFQVFI